ncbi:MAG: hypothetical protein HC933_09250 [Pleurocapsa sp. SU_196_0]|nr:hypothetical protein [Pleurocapsa sp. SU_196_0]
MNWSSACCRTAHPTWIRSRRRAFAESSGGVWRGARAAIHEQARLRCGRSIAPLRISSGEGFRRAASSGCRAIHAQGFTRVGGHTVNPSGFASCGAFAVDEGLRGWIGTRRGFHEGLRFGQSLRGWFLGCCTDRCTRRCRHGKTGLEIVEAIPSSRSSLARCYTHCHTTEPRSTRTHHSIQ